MRFRLLILSVVGVITFIGLISVNVLAVEKNNTKAISDNLTSLQALPTEIDSIKPPEIKNPEWLQTILDAEHQASQQTYSARKFSGDVVTYDVATRGAVTALAEFKALAAQTYADSRGWARLGVSFQEVASGGSFTLWLSEASQVPSFYPSVCSIYWSCSVGRNVIINQDRWIGASDAWNSAGGLIRDYRNMVINHETGHWLGHGHLNCGGAGQPAPVMQQQSIDLQGCSFNPWPLDSELWSSTLGI